MKVNKNLFKKMVLGTSVFAFSMMLGVSNSKAVLQSNGNTSARYNVDQWMLNIRKMESLGGAMGLSETFNSNLTSSSASNNVDVHMQKNTEYGALAILSASSYGNPSKIESGQTTTGNITGVVMNLNKEWVAGGAIYASNYYKNAVGRYKNLYTESYVAKKGDAISETAGWHGSSSSAWMPGKANVWQDENRANNTCGLLRSYSGSIFSYNADGVYQSGYNNPQWKDARWVNTWSSRAVVVIGEGL